MPPINGVPKDPQPDSTKRIPEESEGGGHETGIDPMMLTLHDLGFEYFTEDILTALLGWDSTGVSP